MELRHPVREDDAPEPRRPAILRLFCEDVRTSRRPRDLPCVIRVDAEAESVPGNPLTGLELENGGADGDAERPPCERGRKRSPRLVRERHLGNLAPPIKPVRTRKRLEKIGRYREGDLSAGDSVARR